MYGRTPRRWTSGGSQRHEGGQDDRHSAAPPRSPSAVATLTVLTFAVTAPGSRPPPAQAAPLRRRHRQRHRHRLQGQPALREPQLRHHRRRVRGRPPEHRARAPRARPSTSASSASRWPPRAARAPTPPSPSESQPQPVIVNADDEGAAEGKYRPRPRRGHQHVGPGHQGPARRGHHPVAPVGDVGSVFDRRRHQHGASGIVERRASGRPGPSPSSATSSSSAACSPSGACAGRPSSTTGGDHDEHAAPSRSARSTSLGVPIPLPSDALGQLRVLQRHPGALGLTVTPPATRVEQGIVFVDPLTIGIIPVGLRDGIIGADPRRRPSRSARRWSRRSSASGCGHDPDIFGNNAETAVTVLDLALGLRQRRRCASPSSWAACRPPRPRSPGFSGLGVIPALADSPNVPSVNLPPDPRHERHPGLTGTARS